ncbi:MAG: D-alanyl-D-alanine carboxypeptidase family protein, partial [Stellaceae bacterium]
AESGRVIEAHAPDAQNYPASLTKMMTLYLAFKGLEAGKLKLDQPFTVSAHAAAQAPSKLGLKPGERVSLHDLIFAIITHSANDAAVVIAENIGGSESAFAQRMNEEAKELGMQHTHFENASGLPSPPNVSTARDLALLSRALYRDFPKRYTWFSTEEFTFRGVKYGNHNHLMHSFAGMDGIKTGYIHASGFNLAASAVRNGRRLIAVVMGGESARSRDKHVASLLNAAFDRPSDDEQVADDDTTPTDPQDSLAHRAGRALAAISPVARAQALTPDEESQREAAASDRWSVQVGAFAKRKAAERAAGYAVHHVRGVKARNVQVLVPASADKDKVYRARLVHLTRHEAVVACRTLHRKHRSCAVLVPNAAELAAE